MFWVVVWVERSFYWKSRNSSWGKGPYCKGLQIFLGTADMFWRSCNLLAQVSHFQQNLSHVSWESLPQKSPFTIYKISILHDSKYLHTPLFFFFKIMGVNLLEYEGDCSSHEHHLVQSMLCVTCSSSICITDAFNLEQFPMGNFHQ